MGNLIESFIRAFKPIPNYNIIINRCRLYNSYIGIYNVILIILLLLMNCLEKLL